MSDLLASFLVQGRSMVFVQLTALSVLLLIAILIWGQLDQRTLDGVPVWVKPAKFAVSFLVHFATLAIIVDLMSPENAELRIVAGVGWVLAAAPFILRLVKTLGMVRECSTITWLIAVRTTPSILTALLAETLVSR